MTVVYLLISWFLGLWLAAFTAVSPNIALIFAFLFGVGGVLLRRKGQLSTVLLCLGVASFANVRYQAALPTVDAHHVAFYSDNLTVNIKGIVIDEPDVRDRYVNLRVAADTVQLRDGEPIPVQGDILVQAFRYPEIGYGTEVWLNGRLQPPPDPENDNEFNYRAYLANQGIHAMMTFPAIEPIATNQANPLRYRILQGKQRAQAAINEALVDPQAALLSGILLGNDNGMPDDLDEAFRRTGMTHIIAISGFNIAILIWILLALGRPFFSLRGTAVFATVGISLYAILVGADPSVLRAAVMGGFYLFSTYWLGRPTYAIASLLWAGFALTLHDPLSLWDVGFQLSFAATLSLMLYAKPLTKWASWRIKLLFERRVAERLVGVLTEAVFVTVAAQILTLPLMMAQFGELSLVSLLANALILPAQPMVMLWGGFATIAGMLVPPLGVALGWVAWLFLSYNIWLVQLLGAVSWASVPVAFSWWHAGAIYGGLFATHWFQRQPAKRREAIGNWARQHVTQRLALGSTMLGTVLVFSWGLAQPDGDLHIYFLDVGQGDATLIVTPTGRHVLIDGGYYPSVLNGELGTHLPFWQKRIDLMVATHPDADHVTALVDVFPRYQVDMLLTNGAEVGETAVYDALLLAAEDEGSVVKTAVLGETIMIEDGVTLQILHPGERRYDERNDNSIAMRLTYKEFSFIFTGDAEQLGERAILQSGLPLQAQVYQAGHHGANSSSSEPLLNAIQPQMMVISSGADNRFGHPHEEVLTRAVARGTAVLRTDQLGTIEVRTDGARMWWFSHR